MPLFKGYNSQNIHIIQLQGCENLLAEASARLETEASCWATSLKALRDLRLVNKATGGPSYANQSSARQMVGFGQRYVLQPTPFQTHKSLVQTKPGQPELEILKPSIDFRETS